MMASMALHATRLALLSSRRHVTVGLKSLTPLHACRVDNTFIYRSLHSRLTQVTNSTHLRRKPTPVPFPYRCPNHECRCLSSVAFNKVPVAQQLAQYLGVEDMIVSNNTYNSTRSPSGELSDVERLISRYIITIASEPSVNPKNIVDIFDLYARTGRPLVQDMHNFPTEFQKLAPISELALSSMTYADLQNLAKSLGFLRNQDLKIVHRLIKALCHECCSRLNYVPIHEGIKYFEIVHHFHGTQQPFFAIFSEYFSRHIDEASKKELVKLMHFCTKKQKTADANFVQNALNKLEDSLESVSFVTLGVVAESVAKSGLELSNQLPLLQKLVPLVVTHIAGDDKKLNDLEMYALHSILNLFRLARFTDDDVTSVIETFLLTCEDSSLDAQTITGFLAFLASRSYHQQVFDRLEALTVLLLKSNDSVAPKLHEFARMLWAFSSTNHQCSEEFVSLVFDNFHSLCTLEYTNQNFLKFVDGLLSLAMMGHIDGYITPVAFQPLKDRAKGYGSSGPLLKKLTKCLVVLRECLSIEAPLLSLPPLKPSSVPSDLSPELQRRPALFTLFDQLKHLNECSKAGAVVYLARPISSVALTSVCIDTVAAASSLANIDKCLDATDEQFLRACAKLGSNVSIEVLDDTCTMKDVQQGIRSTGLVNFKTRLVKKVGWKSLHIAGDEIEKGVLTKTTLLDTLRSLS